jgi:pantetheine-phosphate adenylyltransferase
MKESSGMALAIYPGTFDPFTYGHLDIVRRARTVFARVVVAVAAEGEKKTLFTSNERIELIRASTKGMRGVRVEAFEGLLVDYAVRLRASAIVRGLRAFSDFEYELELALMNRSLCRDIETVFFMTSEAHASVSSTLVKEVARLGGDVRAKVPPPVARALSKRATEG